MRISEPNYAKKNKKKTNVGTLWILNEQQQQLNVRSELDKDPKGSHHQIAS